MDSLSHPLVKISLQRSHGQTVAISPCIPHQNSLKYTLIIKKKIKKVKKNGAFSHETNYIEIFSEILNLEGRAPENLKMAGTDQKWLPCAVFRI